MIPIQLTLEGLYSYKEPQHIDFQPLIAAGLFGLFGAVGSGKSSILEAIMLALYNKTERLTNFKNYNIMNLQSNELFIDFVFYSGTANKEKFRATYASRRNSKDFNDVKIKERCYYKWEQEQWLPLEIDNAADILGMSYENFMKTVIIPQGKFREFVDQSTSARAQMLKELFPLEKFDLFNKTNRLLTQTKADIQTVEKLLEEVGALSMADIEVLEEEIKALELDQKNNAEMLVKLRKAEEKLRLLEGLFKNFYEVSETLNHLKADQELFKNREVQLNTYSTAYTYFKDKLISLNQYYEELQRKKSYLKSLNAESVTAQESLNNSRLALEEAKGKLDQVEETKQKCEDLKVIIAIGEMVQTAQSLEVESKAADEEVRKLREALQVNQQNMAICEDKVKGQELALQDVEQLKEILYWKEREVAIKEEMLACGRQIEVFTKNNAALSESLLKATLEHDIVSIAHPDEGVAMVAKEKALLQALVEDLQQQLMPLKVKQQLAEYASALEKEQPCPLCGSPHHPEPVAHATVFKEIAVIEEKLKASKARETKLILLEQQIQDIRIKMAGNQEMIQNSKSVAQKLEEKLEQHLLLKPEIAAEYEQVAQIKQKLQEKSLIRQELQATKDRREQLKENIVAMEGALEAKRNFQQEILQQQAAEAAKIEQLKQMLKVYDFSKFERHSVAQLSASLERGLTLIADLQRTFEEATSKVQTEEQHLSKIKGQLSAEEAALDALLLKTNELDAAIQLLLKEKGFHSIKQVNGILGMNLNMEWERQEIERYKHDLLKVEQQWHNLKKEIANREYSASHHQEVIQEMEDLEEKAKIVQSKISVKKREIEEIEKKIERRKALFEEQEKLELRKQNLSELCNLFRGNGFMNYVSSLYLNNLCKAANERFLLLTKNNLSLELNEQNEFVVRDYLNNGKTRLLKTLSGGQTFQASLCLALALAENVKSLNKAEESFFFLDEGFGALDKHALRVVFDTLKTLRKENRVVGIISHVEELQQEMDIYLEVENDREKGSQISCSWK